MLKNGCSKTLWIANVCDAWKIMSDDMITPMIIITFLSTSLLLLTKGLIIIYTQLGSHENFYGFHAHKSPTTHQNQEEEYLPHPCHFHSHSELVGVVGGRPIYFCILWLRLEVCLATVCDRGKNRFHLNSKHRWGARGNPFPFELCG